MTSSISQAHRLVRPSVSVGIDVGETEAHKTAQNSSTLLFLVVKKRVTRYTVITAEGVQGRQ